MLFTCIFLYIPILSSRSIVCLGFFGGGGLVFCFVLVFFLQHAQVSQIIQKIDFLEIPFLEPSVLLQSALFPPQTPGSIVNFYFVTDSLKFHNDVWIFVYLLCSTLGRLFQCICFCTRALENLVISLIICKLQKDRHFNLF